MAGPITISVVGDVRDLVRGIGTARGELDGLGRYARGAGLAVKAGIGLAAGALIAFGVKAVKAASDAEQSIGATETVYGRFADVVVERSNEAADAVGLSANEYRELANVLGASLKGAGVPLKEVTDLTATLNERAADLAATFGGSTREAVQAVGSLLRGEADPIERYGVSIKQTDVNARLAAEGMGELEGAARKQAEIQARVRLLLDQSSDSAGAFARESDTLAGAQQRLDANVENLEARFGKLLIPVLADAATMARTELLPVVEDLAGWFEDNRDEIGDLASAARDSLFPALRSIAEVGGDVVGFLAELPAPIQSLAIQAGAAFLVMPRLIGTVRDFGTAASTTAAKIRDVETRTQALGAAARQAAGVAGILALTTAAGHADDSLGLLGSAAGGALLGFSVAGPIGGAIGAGAGALYGLKEANDAARESFHSSLKFQEDYTDSLDQTTAALTEQTRAIVYRNLLNNESLTVSRALGIADRDVVGAVLGQEDALRRVTRVVQDHTGNLKQLTGANAEAFYFNPQSASDFLNSLRVTGGQVRANQRDLLAQINATKNWTEALKGVPRNVRTVLRQDGYAPNLKQLRTLNREYDLTPKQIRTILKATGTDATVRQVRGVREELERTGRTKPDTAPWLKGLTAALGEGKREADRGGSDLAEALRGGTRKARADLGPFRQDFSGGLSALSSAASSGGARVGSDLGAGLAGGVDEWVDDVAAAARRMVAAALAAAHDEADSHSPSRKTHRLGRDLGKGLANGLTEEQRETRKAARDFIAATLDRMAEAIDRVRGKLNDLRHARDDYVTGIAEAAQATANITTVGLREDGTQTAGDLTAALEDRLDKIRAFQAKVKELIGQGLKGDALRQLLEAGVDAGTVTADALLAGGPDAVNAVVELQQQIADAAGDVGAIGGRFYSAGIAAQEDLLRGLLADRKRLDDAGRRIAMRLAKAIRRELARGIDDYDRVDLGHKGGGGRHRIVARAGRLDLDATGGSYRSASITLSAEQLSQLERGRRLRIDLDAWDAAGGRRKARA